MKNKWLWISIVVVIILIGILLFVFRHKFFPKDEKEQQQEEQSSYQAAVQTAQQNNTPPPPPPVSTLPSGSFPLTSDDKNQKVKSMQEALIKMGAPISAGATGYFGSQTKSALSWAGYGDKIDEIDYNNILAGKKKTTLTAGTSPVATKSSGPVYDSLSMNKIVEYTSAGISYGYLVKTVGNFLALSDSVGGTPKYYVSKEYFT